MTLHFQPSEDGGLLLRLSGAGEATEPIAYAQLTELLAGGMVPAGQGWGERAGLRNLQRMEAVREERPEDIGRRLFDTLFVGRIRELFCSQLGALNQGEEHGIRLRLSLDITTPRLRRLQNLPWELLWYSGWQAFFALDRRISLSRALDVPRPCGPFPALESIRCLVATASPEGLQALDLEEEVKRIRQALAGQDRIAASYLSPAGPQSIRERLLQPSADILHFAGHGYDDGDLGLVLEGRAKQPYYFEAERWAEQVGDLKLRLVVLNACSTAVPSTFSVEPFHGVAQALIRAGVPAVVAMRQPIKDEAGLIFAQVFYGRLAAGDPIDAALVEARKALRAELPGKSLDWTIPALFLRGESGDIFAAAAGAAEPAEAMGKAEDFARVKVGDLGDSNQVAGNEQFGSGAVWNSLKSEVSVEKAGSGNRIVGNVRRF